MEVRLVSEKGSRRSHVFRMRAPVLVIGRKQGSGVRVPSAAVSRQHCRLEQADGFVTVEDLDSVNGTLLNGLPVSGRQTVRPGDRLKVGPVTFVVEYELDPEALDRLTEWEEARAQAAEPLPALDFVDDGEEMPTHADFDDPAVPLPMEEAEDEDFALPVLDEEPQPLEPEPLEPEPLLEFDNDLPAGDKLRDLLSQLEQPEDD